MAQVLSGLSGVVYYIDDKRRTHRKFASSTPENKRTWPQTQEVQISIFHKRDGIFGAQHISRGSQANQE